MNNFWTATQGARRTRPALSGSCKADVAIIGAGFTGLWTAYYLKTLEPALDIAVVEADDVGHGASGRNGGWVIAGIAGLARLIGHLPFTERRACCDLLAANVDEFGRVLAAERIAADFHQGGSIAAAARYPDQVAFQRHYLEHLHELGYREDACYWLDADRLAERVRFNNGYGGKPKHRQGIGMADIRLRQRLLADLIPALKDVKVTHGWGGSIGLSRSFQPHAVFDRKLGLATAGGYAGEGVAASHLFARTLAELILGVESQRTALPWAHVDARFDHVIKSWEPEPLRWLTTRAVNSCYAGEEALMRRPNSAKWLKSALARINDRFDTIVE